VTRTIPERVRWAVATLDVDPADRILELGSGPGAAISLVCERLDGGTEAALGEDHRVDAARQLAQLGERHRQLARQLVDDATPVVWVTHSEEQMRRLADHVLLLADGRVDRSGSAAEVLGER